MLMVQGEEEPFIQKYCSMTKKQLSTCCLLFVIEMQMIMKTCAYSSVKPQ
jgi:hypothetical protein